MRLLQDSLFYSNWAFIVLNLPIQEDSKAQQNQKSSQPNYSIQRQKRDQAPRRRPGDDQGQGGYAFLYR